MSILFDADAVSTSLTAVNRRARTTVAEATAQAEAAERAGIVTAYAATRGRDGRRRLLNEAAAYDRSHPGETSLYDELLATSAGDLPEIGVAA